MLRLQDAVAIVSGADGGMGLEYIRALTAEGARVVGFDLTDGRGRALADELGPDRVQFMTGDVTSAQDWSQVVGHCSAYYDLPSVLINNAGIFRAHSLVNITEAQYRTVVNVNQIGCFLGINAVIEPMRRRGGGSIVNISSTSGLVGYPDEIAYVASKWAVRGMTKAAAVDLAPYGIRVNAICQSETDTPMIRPDGHDTAPPPPTSGFRRWAKPREIAAAVIYLASNESTTSGSDIVIDAGYTAA